MIEISLENDQVGFREVEEQIGGLRVEVPEREALYNMSIKT
jgi:hypothetical protein